MAVSGAWTYTESGGNATITDYDTGVGGFTPTIPTTLDTFPVIAIADGAMESKSLTSVTIGHSLDLVGDAIANNGTLTVTINANVTTSSVSIGASPFRACALGANLTLGASVTTISRFLFYNAGVTSLTIASNITLIDDYSFRDNSISSLDLDHAIDFGDDAFASNTGISVTLNADVTTTKIVNQNTGVFRNCSIGTALTITSNVTNIPRYLFSTAGLTEVTIPSSVTTLGLYTFSGNSLTALDIPSTITTIPDGCFSNNSISSLELNHAMDFGDYSFQNNTGMTLTVNANVTTVGVGSKVTSVFDGCSLGSNVTITTSVTAIPQRLFAESGLISITFPSSVTTVGNDVFYNNDNLETIIFEAQETITFGTLILDGSTPSPKGTIYGYDSSVETWASGESIPTYYDFSYDVPGSSAYMTNFSNSMYNSSKFSKVIEFLA